MWRLHPYNVPGVRHFYMAWRNRCWRCLWSPYHGSSEGMQDAP